jgi:hypothetical protein
MLIAKQPKHPELGLEAVNTKQTSPGLAPSGAVAFGFDKSLEDGEIIITLRNAPIKARAISKPSPQDVGGDK